MGERNQKLIKNLSNRFEVIKNKRLLIILEKTAWDLVEKTQVPIVTHNLWDSIGCGIYHNGVLMKMVFQTQQATKPRNKIYGINVPDRDYWGIKELSDMIENPPARVVLTKGWCLYYVAAMPYSQIQEEKGVDVLRDELVKPIFKTHIHTLDL